LLGERWNHSEDDLAKIQPRDAEVIVMLQGRLRIRRRRLQHHDAGPGMVWLSPADNREDMIHLYGHQGPHGQLGRGFARLGQRRRSSGRSGTGNSRGGA
jgi:hypothetical protein